MYPNTLIPEINTIKHTTMSEKPKIPKLAPLIIPSLKPVISTFFNYGQTSISKIDDRLFLGAYPTQQLINSNNITHIINVTTDFPTYVCPNIMTIQLNDCINVNIGDYFESAHNFIQQSLNSNGTVLVHCHAGISRSATILISFYMKTKNMTMYEALNYIRARRPIVEPNIGFIEILLSYEMQLKTQQNPKKSLNLSH